MHVTHLECSLTGERYPAGEPTISARRASRCSFATTSIGAPDPDPRKPGAARAGHVEMARAAAAARRRRAGQPGRARNADRPARQNRCESGREWPARERRGAAADRIVQGARAGDGSFDGEAVRDQEVALRPTAMPERRSRLMRPAREWRRSSSAPPKHPRSTCAKPQPTALASGSPTARSTNAGADPRRRGRRALVRLFDARRSPTVSKARR